MVAENVLGAGMLSTKPVEICRGIYQNLSDYANPPRWIEWQGGWQDRECRGQ